MNMAKLGTVSAGAIRPSKLSKPINYGLYKVTSYTLCEIMTSCSQLKNIRNIA